MLKLAHHGAKQRMFMSDKIVVAIIGSREPTDKQRKAVRIILERFNPDKYQIISGCAYGVDAIALETAFNMGFKTIGMLPWGSYNRDIQEFCHVVQVITDMDTNIMEAAEESVHNNHPASQYLSRGAMKLHMRNYGIIRWASVVYAMPSTKKGGGGTGQGIRLAEAFNIKVVTIKPYFTIREDIT